MMKTCSRTAALIAAIALFAATDARNAKASITYSVSSGTKAATATFDNSVSGTLTVTLANVGGDVLVPTDVLTGIFFNLSAGPALTPVSAQVAPGSAIVFDTDGNPATLTPGTSVGGEWGYKTGLSGAPLSANTGISSTGLGLFGPGDRFDTGSNLEGPPSGSLGGAEYGLLSAVDNLLTGNAAVLDGGNNDAFIKNAVVFKFTTTGVFDTSRLSKVSFQYGTALDEPNLPVPPPDEIPPPVPEPSTLLMGAVAMVGLGVARFRSKKS